MSMLRNEPANGAIPPELRRELQQELAELLAREPEPISTDIQEHAVLLRLREEAATGGATPVNGEIQRFRPGQPIDYENEGVLEQTTHKTVLAPQVRLALMGVAVLLVFGVLALNTVFAAPANESAPVAPSPSVAADESPAPTQEPLGSIRIGNSNLPAVYPNAIGIGQRQWAVTAAAVEKGEWSVRKEANVANWLLGSVVNWSFGLWNDAEGSNSGVFEQIEETSTLTLWLSSGAVRTFRLQQPQTISRPQITVLSQHEPGLTLVLIGGDSAAMRQVVRGVETTVTAGASPTSVESAR